MSLFPQEQAGDVPRSRELIRESRRVLVNRPKGDVVSRGPLEKRKKENQGEERRVLTRAKGAFEIN